MNNGSDLNRGPGRRVHGDVPAVASRVPGEIHGVNVGAALVAALSGSPDI